MVNYSEIIEQTKLNDKERGFKFTTDWFHGGIQYDFDQNIKLDKDCGLKILEIGAFEGKSTVWISETYLCHPNSKLTVIDPYLTSDITTDVKDETIEFFLHNISLSRENSKIEFIRDLSENILPIFVSEKRKYDLIFIDGSHLSRDIILDVVLSWKMIKKGGYLVMDDYNNNQSEIKKCLDFWLSCLNRNEYIKVFDKYQVIVKKL